MCDVTAVGIIYDVMFCVIIGFYDYYKKCVLNLDQQSFHLFFTAYIFKSTFIVVLYGSQRLLGLFIAIDTHISRIL